MSVQNPPYPTRFTDAILRITQEFLSLQEASSLLARSRSGRDLARLCFEAIPKGTLVSQGGLAHRLRSRALSGSPSREDSRSSWRDLARQTCPCTSPLERDLARQT